MISKQVYVSEDEQRAHEARWGTYNEYPPNWTKLSEEEFAQSGLFTWGFDQTEYRQMYREMKGTKRTKDMLDPVSRKENGFTSAYLFFLRNNTGYAIVNDYWGKKIHYYTFGCNHEWGSATEELARLNRKLFRTEHARYCSKCKYLEIIDSSD